MNYELKGGDGGRGREQKQKNNKEKFYFDHD